MPSQLSFESSLVDGDMLVIVLNGDLDTTTTEEFENEVQRQLDEGLTKIIIDCRRLGFISSIGIGSLMTLKTRLNRKGGSVKLAAIQGMAATVIEAVKLDKILEIYGDQELARQSFVD